MKKTIWIALAALLLMGCRDQLTPDLNPDDLGDRVFQVTATVGEDDETETRVTLTPDGMGMSLAWEVGDSIEILFRQTLPGQETTRVKSTTTIKSITSNGKRGTFDIVVPTEINLDSPFDLYGVYGGGGLDETNPNRAIFPVNIGGTLDKVEEQKEVMLVFRKTNITDMSQPLSVNFQHIGHLFCLKLKNDGTETLHLNSIYLTSYVPNAENPDYKKWVMSGTGNYYDMETQQYSSATTREDNLTFAMPESGIAPGDSCMLYAWCKAAASQKVKYYNTLGGFYYYENEVPQLQLVIVRPSGNKWYTSAKTPRKGSAPPIGRCFHFVASVTNTAVYFDFADFTKPNTTMTGLALKGDLLYAFGSREGWSLSSNAYITLPSVIGVLYSRADSLFYNEASDGTGISINDPYYAIPDRYEANWGTEVFLGKGLTEVCAADGCSYGDVYIAYVTPEGKIGWRNKLNRTLPWSDEQLIESQGGGVCSKPDIVRAEGRDPRTFIVYTDSKVKLGQDNYAKGIMATGYGYNQDKRLFIEERTERPEGGYIEERYPQGARTTAGHTTYNSSDEFFLNHMTLRERITVSSEEVVESTEYDIIITTGYYDSSPAKVASYTIPVSSSDHIFDITSRHLADVLFAAAYTKNNVLQITYFTTDYKASYPSSINLLTEHEDALPSVQLSNTSENPAFLSYVSCIYTDYITTGLGGIDPSGNLINVSSHFSCDANSNYSYVKRAQFIHNTSKQVKPGTVATSVDFANTHIYSVYTDLDGYIRIEYIDSKNRDDWQ